MSERIPFLEELREQLVEAAEPTRAPAPRQQQKGRRSGPISGVLVFLGVVVIGLLTWALTGFDTENAAGDPPLSFEWDLEALFVPPATNIEAFLADVDGIPGVRIIDYYPNASVIRPALPATTEVGSLFLALSDDRDALGTGSQLIEVFESGSIDYVGINYSDVIVESLNRDYFEWASNNALVLGDDSRVLQPVIGPEPEFDTSFLGSEVTLEPANAVPEILDSFFTTEVMPPDEAFQPNDSLPLLHIGLLPETGNTMVVYGSKDGFLCSYAVSETFSGGGCGGFHEYPYGVFGFGGKEGGVGYSFVFTPESTAAVGFVANDSDRLWQRPTAGWTMFPTPLVEGATARAVAYDSTGGVLGDWEATN